MTRFRLAPLALALLALASCGKKDAAPAAKPGSVAAMAAPAGTVWADQIVATDEGVRMGNPKAPIQLVEYGSYTCPHCKAFSEESHDALVKDYVNTGKVSFEYRNLVRDPLDIAVALIAHCNGPQPYFTLSAQLFANQEDMIKQLQTYGDAAYKNAVTAAPDRRFIQLAELGNLIEWAKTHGIPEDKAKTCLANTKMADELAKITQEAGSKYNIQGTPSFLLNGSLLDNTATWSALEAKLHDAGA